MKIGIVVGRFQVPRLHQGHLALLDHASANCDKLLILLGCSTNPPNRREPLDFRTRQMRIQMEYPQATILPQWDNPSDEVWSANIVRLVHSLFPDTHDAVMFGGRDSCLSHFHGSFKKEYVEDINLSSGTDVRKTAATEVLSDEAFASGCIYTVYRMRPAPIMAVDIALIRKLADGEYHILLGRKPGEILWRLPGGKVDVTDQSLEACGRRELQEEAGIFAEHMEYVNSYLVNDWRFAKNPDAKIMTVLYIGREMALQVEKAGDDLAEVKWFRFTDVELDNLVTAHRPFLPDLRNYILGLGLKELRKNV